MNLDEASLHKLGEKIRQFRRLNKLTQEDLAIAINTQRECISRIERGMLDVRFCTLLHIAFALKIPLPELVQKI